MTDINNKAANRLLNGMARQVDRACASTDPVGRARTAVALQWASGWALRAAIDECRAAGMSWPTISAELGIAQTTVFEQYRSGGPVIVTRPRRGHAHRGDA